MAIHVACLQCGKTYQAKEKAAGKRFECRQCGATILIPSLPENQETTLMERVVHEVSTPPPATIDVINVVLEPDPVEQGNDHFSPFPLPDHRRLMSHDLRRRRKTPGKRHGMMTWLIGGLAFCAVIVVAVPSVNERLSSLMSGVFAQVPGSREAACSHLESELEKWMIGKPSDNEESQAVVAWYDRSSVPPISYEIKSVLPTRPSPWHIPHGGRPASSKKPFEEYPTYLINVTLEFKSQAETPLMRIRQYTLIWDGDERKWHIFRDYSSLKFD